MDPVGVYISVPFCRAKCTFCNFASGVYPAEQMPVYVDAVLRQLRTARTYADDNGLVLPERVDTVYLGGGTPSLLPPELLRQLFDGLRQEFAIDPDAEITLEAAPMQLEPATLDGALRCGVNRISFGVQSFIDGEARATARTHTGDEALAEIERMRTAGVTHVSADLIAGLPGQTETTWRQSLEALAGSAVDHASIYMFELDEDSRLGSEALAGGVRYGASLLPRDEAVADWYLLAIEQLAAAHLMHYEISNFARSGGTSRHNERYWLRKPYLGLGADAHSMLLGRSGPGARFEAPDDLRTFIAVPAFSEAEHLTHQAVLEELVFLGLRRMAGVSRADLLESAAQSWGSAAMDAALLGLLQDGLLHTPAPGMVALTPRGCLLSNTVFAELLSAAEAIA